MGIANNCIVKSINIFHNVITRLNLWVKMSTKYAIVLYRERF